MKSGCSITDFYLMLKLGIFDSARVENVGYFSRNEINNVFLKKPLSAYENQVYAKKQLSLGLFLLDCFLLTIDNNKATYMLVVSVCRISLVNKERLYVLKLSDISATANIESILSYGGGASSSRRRRKSVFSKRSRNTLFDYTPLNSTPRKY